MRQAEQLFSILALYVYGSEALIKPHFSSPAGPTNLHLHSSSHPSPRSRAALQQDSLCAAAFQSLSDFLTLPLIVISNSAPTVDAPLTNETRAKMPADYSPPDSPLSSMESDEGYEDEGHEYDEAARRPSKRQRLDAGSTTSSAVVQDAEPETVPEPDTLEGLSDVSSDTSGDIPSSPVNARLDDDDFQDQVTVCDWDGCPAGDQGNMDKLVEHIHNSHIENRQKKYTCEWRSCNRKGLPHASGYALKAHMRSHTREKPFYCYLPGEPIPVLIHQTLP